MYSQLSHKQPPLVGHPTIVSFYIRWKHFSGYPKYFLDL